MGATARRLLTSSGSSVGGLSRNPQAYGETGQPLARIIHEFVDPMADTAHRLKRLFQTECAVLAKWSGGLSNPYARNSFSLLGLGRIAVTRLAVSSISGWAKQTTASLGLRPLHEVCCTLRRAVRQTMGLRRPTIDEPGRWACTCAFCTRRVLVLFKCPDAARRFPKCRLAHSTGIIRARIDSHTFSCGARAVDHQLKLVADGQSAEAD